MNVPEFSVRHAILGNMLTLFVLVGGLIAVFFVQRDTFPELELDLVVITTPYPNASAKEVEDLVTNPIEDEIREVEDIEEFTSTSVEGISVVVAELDPDARYKERVINEIQRKVDRVAPELPEGAEDPEVEAIENRGPIIRVCVSGRATESELRDYGDYLENRFQSIPGVSTVTKEGWRDEEFWVEVNLDTIEEQELALTDVVRALARRNVNRPGGKLPEGPREVVLRTIGQFHTAEEIEDVVVRSNTDGNHIRVEDIGEVRRTFEEDTVFTKVNGTRAVVLGVKKKRSGDTIAVADAVKTLAAEERATAPEGIVLTTVDDESFYVKRRLNVLKWNGLIGFALVVVVLFLFLNFRLALITGIGIPFALLAALMLMSLLGITINLITMFGLIIVLGMLVDDAIIVGENVFSHLEEGHSPREAAVRGTSEVMYPVVATVLTTVAAFAPLAFAPDTWGQVMRWFPIVIAITLAASLFEVLLVMPTHVVDFARPIRVETRRNHVGASAHQWMDRVQRVYDRLLRGALRYRYLFLVATLAVAVGTGWWVKERLRVDIFPADLIDAFIVRVWAPQGTRLEATEMLTADIASRIRELPEGELENIVSYIGGHIALEGGYDARGTHYASVVVYLTPQNTRERKTKDIIEAMRSRTVAVEGVEKLEFEMIEPGPPTGRPLEVKVRGESYDTLRRLSAELIAFLEAQDGVYDIRQDYEPGKDEIHVRVDEQEAARLGLDMAAIAETVYTAFQGAESTMIREGNDEVVVRVRLMVPDRERMASLERLYVPNRTGRLIPLSRVARFERQPGLPAIHHYDGDRVVTVSASIDTDRISSMGLNRSLERAFMDVPQRYPGYDLIRGGEWKETRNLLHFMIKAFSVAMLLIYVILAVQFDSYFQPFVVMVAIPLGVLGVLLALVAHAKPISVMAMMGTVGLAGVVVNDAIVLVKFINDQRRNNGATLFDAVVLAGKRRVRPILLTSVTTIAGLLPVIYGIGGYEPFVAPAAIVLAYGLLFATLLTLLVVPAVYVVGYDVKRLAVRAAGVLARRTRSRGARAPAHA